MTNQTRISFPKSGGIRVVVGILSLPSGVLFGSLLVHMSTELSSPPSVADAILGFILFEFAFSFFAIPCLALIWAIATPTWLERLIQRHMIRAILMTLVGGVLGFAFIQLGLIK